MVPASGEALDQFMQGLVLPLCDLELHKNAFSLNMEFLYHQERLVDEILWCLAGFGAISVVGSWRFGAFAFVLRACAGPWPLWHYGITSQRDAYVVTWQCGLINH